MKLFILALAIAAQACTGDCEHHDRDYTELAGGQVDYVLSRFNGGAPAEAITFPGVDCGTITVWFKNSNDVCLKAHEQTHVGQIIDAQAQHRDWLWDYTKQHFTVGYEKNPYEIAARAVQDACEKGRAMYRSERAGQWPGYAQHIVDLDLPDDDSFDLSELTYAVDDEPEAA